MLVVGMLFCMFHDDFDEMRLNKIKEGKYEYQNQVNKVPVQAHFSTIS
jgi:hypothetical protein